MPLLLKERVFRAGGWTMAGLGLSQTLRFGSNLVMTHLLVPEMFSIVAIANIVIMGLAMFSDLGLRQSIVQSKSSDTLAFLNTAWSVQILRGGAIGAVAVLAGLLIWGINLAGWVPKESVYAHPQLPFVIAVLSISALLAGFESTKLAEARRNLSMHRVVQIELASQIFGLIVMFVWASISKSIWAIVAGGVFSQLLKVMLSHSWMPGNPNKWYWDKAALREILRFGKWIFASSILGFLVNNGDRLVLGFFVDTTVLGVYVIAFLIYSAVDQVLGKLLAEVSFPAFSELARERPGELKPAYYRFHALVASFTYFCAGVLMASGQTLVGLLYDQRYAEAGWMLQLLASALLTLPFRLAGHCFLALGKSKLLTHTIFIQLITLYLFTPLGFKFLGLPGALIGIVLSYYSALPTTIYYMIKHNIFDLRRELLVVPAIIVGLLFAQMINLMARH